MDIEHYLKSLNAELDKEKYKEIYLKFIELRKLTFSNIARAYKQKNMFRESIRYDEFVNNDIKIDCSLHRWKIS